MKNISWISIICIRLLCAPLVLFGQSTPEAEIAALNRILGEKEKFVEMKQRRISSLMHSALAGSESPESQFRLLQRLSEEYKSFIYDSAFTYLQKLQIAAYQTKNPVNIAYAKVQMGSVLLSVGMFKETQDTMKTVSLSGVPDSIKVNYYFTMGRLYYDLGDFDKDRYYTPYYTNLGSQYLDSARNLCEKESYLSLYLNGLKNLKTGNSQSGFDDLSKLLRREALSSHQRAITASTLSYYHISRNETDQAIILLAMAAIGDVESATKETMALAVLAQLLYERRDIKNAYPFIVEAMKDADFYGAKQRKVQLGSIMPVITAAKVNDVEGQRRAAIIYSLLITTLGVLVIVFAMARLRELKKRKQAEKSLQEANRIKDEYIAYYFNIISEYVNRLESLKSSVENKLMMKKPDDIRIILKSINAKKERDELFRSFDSVFIKIFPDFVSTFNSFFKEEDRIILKDGQLLNTELRIFALIRMGIHDTDKIARILDYSINTIYNYKARVKSRSIIPNEQFEKKIMEIQAY